MLRSTKETKHRNGGIFWDEKLVFDGDDEDDFRVEVYQRHHFPRKRDKLVGSLISTFGEVMTQVNNNGSKSSVVVERSLHKDCSMAANSLGGLDADERQVADVVGTTTQAVDTVAQAASNVQTFRTTWDVLLQRTELFNKIVAGIAEIHPYASLAWSVVSSVNQVLVDPKNCDDRVIRLAGTMSDVFAFVHDAEPLKAVQTRVEPLKLLIQQVMASTRMVKYTLSDLDERITNYQSKLRECGDAFIRGVALQTGIIVDRMQDVIEDTGAEKVEKSVLKDLPYADGAKHDQTKGCLPGTRESILREIYDILNNPAEDAPRICLLTGVAGSGKSAVAHSIARWYDSQDKLGSSYCFARPDVASRNPTNLFSTIARDLADHDRQYKSALCKIVEANRSLCTSRVPMEQLEQLVIEPSRDVRPIGPLVIVIDALDECGDRASRQHLLPALSRLVVEALFPTNLRFLITTRPEDDILDELPSDSYLVRKEMSDIPDESVDADIERFIHHSLDKHSSELQSANQDWCRLLVHHSQHLFQWAATACNFIGGIGSTGLGPSDRVRLLLETYQTEDPLDELYRTVLLQLFKSAPQQDRFREVMVVVLALNAPLPVPSLSALFDGHLKVPVDVRAVVSALASLLDGASNDQKPVRPLHASFYDFLRDTKRSSSAFYIPILPQHSLTIGRASLACMRHMLKFNICDLADSRILNTAIPDLPSRVNRAIPPHLSYSCLYWMNHLQDAQDAPDLLDEVTLFFRGFFPYWIEAISLLSHSSASPISSAMETCTILQHWTQSKVDNNL
ncbi:hypothetical protein JVU11DRAFT_7113 [Chiua virens]|nr:hypothetical protein JVU11DRAFT_7113 [Chiua virens]